MGHASERYDFNSYETDAGRWIAFRQPILREAARRRGEQVEFTYQANPGEVWEEDEFWIELSWRIDPDGSLGVRQHFISPYRPDQKITVDEYYQFVFERVPGLPEKAATENLSPLDYMRKYGAFLIESSAYLQHQKPVPAKELEGTSVDPETGIIRRGGTAVGVQVDGQAQVGFPTPSRKQELYSETLAEWGWPEYATPVYIRSHVHPQHINAQHSEFVLVPTFRLPTLIHSRSGNAKWLAEISNRNPLWIHPSDAHRLGVANDGLVRVTTEIGYFVDRIWATEGLKPGIVACSHHLGRWRRDVDPPANRWATNLVDIQQHNGIWKMRVKQGIEPFDSKDADTQRIFWADGGVHQNLTFPVQPDPISGMHCWHQKVRVEKAQPGDQYGDVEVDTNKSLEVYERWLAMTRAPRRSDRLRRPLWLNRPLRPAAECYYVESK
jgi:anaerobic selenocysteine-containing dehydrogenase